MTPTASPHKTRPITPFRLTPTDEEMLLACARYQYMTVEHWGRTFEEEGKRRYLQRHSQALSGNDYLIRLYITPLGGRDKGRSIFTHGTGGRKFKQSLGRCVSRGASLPGRDLAGTMRARSSRNQDFVGSRLIVRSPPLCRRGPNVISRECSDAGANPFSLA
jgi:hypothetical protein